MHSGSLRIFQPTRSTTLALRPLRCQARLYATKRGGAAADGTTFDEAQLDAARKWLAELDPETIPRSICDVSFSRSSGPGGQNVNKCVSSRDE